MCCLIYVRGRTGRTLLFKSPFCNCNFYGIARAIFGATISLRDGKTLNPSTNKKVTHNATRPITVSQIHGSSMQAIRHAVYQELDYN